MKRLSTQSLPSEPVPKVLSLPKDGWMKISHLNVRSFLAKYEDIIRDQAMTQVNIMCFTETFLQPGQHLESSHLPMINECTVFRQDRVQTSTEDLAKGGIMIVCPSSLYPARINVPHPPQLEILSVETISSHSGGRMCIVAIYRRPQQHLATFLSLVSKSSPNSTHCYCWRLQ